MAELHCAYRNPHWHQPGRPATVWQSLPRCESSLEASRKQAVVPCSKTLVGGVSIRSTLTVVRPSASHFMSVLQVVTWSWQA